VVQVVNVTDGAVATGTTITPFDDTIPQNSEGTEFLSLAITPKSATNILKIDVVASGFSCSAAGVPTVALHTSAQAGALCCDQTYSNAGGTVRQQSSSFTHYMVSGSASAITFSVRIGNSSAGTITFNGSAAVRKLGGTLISSITITEYTP
jgi:hypothetical protein